MAKKIHIGTSGWYYDHWNKIFYPDELSASKRLSFFADHFNTVEINNTFYRIPTKKAIEDWAKKVPEGFLFSVKASGYITHRKRLKDAKESVSLFFERIKPLKEKLGPILFQLPPSFKINLERLESFTALLPKDHLYTFEFRHPTWYCNETYEVLSKNNFSLCITDLGGHLSEEVLTSDFVYVRLHGPKKAYQGSYGPKGLAAWAEKCSLWKKKRSVFCYFDNDEKAYAVKDALKLKSLLGV